MVAMDLDLAGARQCSSIGYALAAGRAPEPQDETQMVELQPTRDNKRTHEAGVPIRDAFETTARKRVQQRTS